MNAPYDIAIIGGGINGCGCAADAALRGLSVVLCEKSDIASQTSSNSSKLIHGGLRYLEQFDFSLVQKALNERQNLLELAPHLVHPLQFVLPHSHSMRPSWMIRLGLFIYDHLSRRNRLPKSRKVTRQQHPDMFTPLVPSINSAFTYYDCSTDDSRLTLANAIQAKQHGANILSQTEVIHAEIVDHIWHLTVKDHNHKTQIIKAKTLINAAGPWVEKINRLLNIPSHHKLSLVKGSHIVLPALYEGQHAYVLQHPDKRIVFAIPYYGYTLVGTTDVPITGTLDDLSISQAEIDYLFDIIAIYFGQRPTQDKMISTWSGVRPLLSDPSKTAQTLTRDYLYHFSSQPAPCITVYGGKITTYRLLAEEVIDQFKLVFPDLKRSNTINTPLPGASQSDDHALKARQAYPWIDEAILSHYLQTYGDRTEMILQNCRTIEELGEHFAGVLYQREVDYLIEKEWATSAEDVLWRRTKLGLDFDVHSQQRLIQYIEQKKL